MFINRSGGFTVGRAGAFLANNSTFVSDDVFSFIPNSKTDAGFVACFLNSWWGKRSLEAGINGSTGQLKLPQGHIDSLQIPIFPLEIQNAIGDMFEKQLALEKLPIMPANDLHVG